MGDLELDTRLSGAGGRYTITLSKDWEIWGPNGGYMAAVALRAAGMEAAIKRPVSIACHFLGVARFEPVDVEVRVLQSGRRAESLHVTITQGDRAIVQAIVRTAAEVPGVHHNYLRMPEVPPPSQLRSFLEHWPDQPDSVPFWQNLDSRIIYPERIFNQDKVWLADLLEWYRYQPRETFDDPFVDAARAVILMDTMAWPAGANPHPPPDARVSGGKPRCCRLVQRTGRGFFATTTRPWRPEVSSLGAGESGRRTAAWSRWAAPSCSAFRHRPAPVRGQGKASRAWLERVPASRSLASFRSPVRSGESPPLASSTLRGKQSPIYGDYRPPVNGSVARQCPKTLIIDGLPALALSFSRERTRHGSVLRLSTPGRQIHRARVGEVRGVRVLGQRRKGKSGGR